jgi:2-amino-4-hydroxy-6-hydroxymethyldihydropteridine diphosphokinase
VHGSPAATLCAALNELTAAGLEIEARSAWYATAPIPRSDQPDYVNGVARVHSDLDAAALLALLHRIEDAYGRVRVNRNEARVLDLDLVDYAGLVVAPDRVHDTAPEQQGLVLPHPRAHLRGFVLLPLRDVAPDWRHPITGAHIDALIGALPDVNDVRRL